MDHYIKRGLVYVLLIFMGVLAINSYRVHRKSEEIMTVMSLDSAGVVAAMGKPSDTHTNGDSTVLVYRISPYIHNQFRVTLDRGGKVRRVFKEINLNYD